MPPKAVFFRPTDYCAREPQGAAGYGQEACGFHVTGEHGDPTPPRVFFVHGLERIEGKGDKAKTEVYENGYGV